MPESAWSDDGEDPIYILLDHSDCEGHIEPWQCIPLAKRLSELVYGWDVLDFDRESAMSLVEGLRLAGSRGERLLFK